MYSRNVLYLYPDEYPTQWKVIRIEHRSNTSKLTLQSNQIPGEFPDSNHSFQVSLTFLTLCGQPTVSNTTWANLIVVNHILLSSERFDDVAFAYTEEAEAPNFYPDKNLFLAYFKEPARDDTNPVQ